MENILMNTMPFINFEGFPNELTPLLVEKTWVCDYASIKRDGTPVTAPLVPYLGENEHSIDIATGLCYPLKAERARSNPKVCLLYGDPKVSLAENPPTILVYGQASVYDANLQANLDRYIRLQHERSESFRKLPPFLVRWMSGYMARIWISVTPLKILWWPEGQLEAPPLEWQAPAETQVSPSDPPPKPLAAPHKAVVIPPTNWREEMARVLDQFGPPTLTVVDDPGYPVPFKTIKASLQGDEVHLRLPAGMPAEAKGRACLNFYKLEIEDGDMTANETVSFIGDVTNRETGAFFEVEKQLPNLSILSGFTGMVKTLSTMRRMMKRAEVEAARRGQPTPKIHI